MNEAFTVPAYVFGNGNIGVMLSNYEEERHFVYIGYLWETKNLGDNFTLDDIDRSSIIALQFPSHEEAKRVAYTLLNKEEERSIPPLLTKGEERSSSINGGRT